MPLANIHFKLIIIIICQYEIDLLTFSWILVDEFLRGIPVTVKKNRVLPLRIALQDGNSSPIKEITDLDITSHPVLQVTFADGTPTAENVTDDCLSAGWGTDGNVFEYDISTGMWCFNLKTKNYTAPGTYTISIVSGDEAEYIIDSAITATFVIK